MIILETKRLYLRTWKKSDIEPMTIINKDPKVCEFLLTKGNNASTLELIKRNKAHYKKYGFGLYAVELKSTHEFIGWTGLAIPSFEAHFTPTVEIGWRLSSNHWGLGYATEAATAVLHYAFTALNLDEIVSFTAVNNKASRRVMEKIGLRYHSRDDFNHPKVEQSHPLSQHVLYRLAKDDYLKSKKSINEDFVNLVFSEAKEHELDVIIALLVDDPIGATREQNTQPFLGDYKKAFEQIQNDRNAKLIVVKLNNQVIGVAQINFIRYLTYQGGMRAQIEGVRIHKDYRSQGLGKQLFKYLIELAKQQHCHLVQLTTDKSRPSAYRFYQKLGFVNSHDGFKLHLEKDAVNDS